MTIDERSLWQAMGDRKKGLFRAKVISPALFSIVYGIYNSFSLGIFWSHVGHTLVPTLGGVASIISTGLYAREMNVEGRSTLGFLRSMAGFIPYTFSLFLMSYLGVYRIWQSLSPLNVWQIVFGLLWIILGYRMLRKFWIITEISGIYLNESKIIERLASVMNRREVLEIYSDEQLGPLLDERVDAG